MQRKGGQHGQNNVIRHRNKVEFEKHWKKVMQQEEAEAEIVTRDRAKMLDLYCRYGIMSYVEKGSKW